MVVQCLVYLRGTQTGRPAQSIWAPGTTLTPAKHTTANALKLHTCSASFLGKRCNTLRTFNTSPCTLQKSFYELRLYSPSTLKQLIADAVIAGRKIYMIEVTNNK